MNIFTLIMAFATVIWIFGWYGVFAVVWTLLAAYHYCHTDVKLGPIERFVEKLGWDEDA